MVSEFQSASQIKLPTNKIIHALINTLLKNFLKIKQLLPLILLLGCISCFQDKPLIALNAQYSPDSTFIVYQYYYGAETSFGDGQFGYRIGKKEQSYDKKLPNLPTTVISEWMDDSTLKAVNLVSKNRANPSIIPKIKTFELSRLKVINHEYYIAKSSSSQYQFERVSETKDSLFFHGIEKDYGLERYDKTAFKKGPITIISQGEFIEKIEIRSIIPAGEEMINITYSFVPKKECLVSSLSGNGLFKAVEIEE